jgi:hypothetical protein
VLFGFVVAHEDNAHLRGRLRAALQQSLPTYMHPARMFVVDRLPLLPGGKVDSAALPALAAETPHLGGQAKPPPLSTQRARDAVSMAWLRTLDRASLEADMIVPATWGRQGWTATDTLPRRLCAQLAHQTNRLRGLAS